MMLMKSSISREMIIHSCKGHRTSNRHEINNYNNYTGCTSLVLYTIQTSLIIIPVINKYQFTKIVWTEEILTDLNYLCLGPGEERFYGMPK